MQTQFEHAFIKDSAHQMQNTLPVVLVALFFFFRNKHYNNSNGHTAVDMRETIPDAPGVWPVSGHKGTCQQWRDRLVEKEVVLKVSREDKEGNRGGRF